MATSTLINGTNPNLDWFAEPLTAIVHLFASQLPAAADDGIGETPGNTSSRRRLPPTPTSELPGRPDPTPGETVDTSQIRPVQIPADPAGAAPAPE